MLVLLLGSFIPKAHALWNQGRKVLALALQSRVSEGILLDHGTGLVIGKTAVIGDRVSLMQAQVMRTRMVDFEARVEEERNLLASRLEEEKNLLATRLDEERKQGKNYKNNFKNLR
ncbi:putative serine O-acetyltransferase [Helianthus annuus]|nr:putative serine O-acetyltransferase [Helianthus annuus]